MTSPRQRKKRLAALRAKQKQLEEKVVVPEKTVESAPVTVVESSAPTTLKAKKAKIGLVELKSQDQVVEQVKEEVKTPTKE